MLAVAYWWNFKKAARTREQVMAQVLLEDVCKVYPGGMEAVRNMSLEIADEEFIVLVGPSGCGKTTTLRMIAGLEEISDGKITIGGRVINDVPPKDRDSAMVFQNYALCPHMTVYKNLAFGLKLRKHPKDEIDQRVNEAAKMLGIGELLDRKPKQLSGGQRQRVALGRAIVRAPKAFLFDEPLSNLDAKLRVETRAELKRLHRRLQTTTIYVTHDQEEAMTLGDRIVVMNNAVIHPVGRPLDIYDRPVDRFVAGFLGTPPMNFFNGKIVESDGRFYFDEGSNKLVFPADWTGLLAPYREKEMVLGIRPENFSPKQEGHFVGQDNSLKIRVEVIEPLGDKIDVYVSTPSHDHIVYTDVSRIHVFEPGDKGRNISHPA